MKNKIRLLLQLLHNNADTSYLLSQGLSYMQISELFLVALKENLITQSDESSFRLTPKGIDELLKINSSNKIDSENIWISSDERYRIEKVTTDEIFLPKLKDTFF